MPKSRAGHTSMINSNPSRFFNSSTRYLETERERSQMEEERQRYRNRRDPENESRDPEGKKNVRCGRGGAGVKTWGGQDGTEQDPGREDLRQPPLLPGKGKGPVHTPLQPLPPLRLPHEPQLQTVHTAAALHHLVSGVQSHVVELVLLEEVAGLGAVAAPEQVLLAGRAVARRSDPTLSTKASSGPARGWGGGEFCPWHWVELLRWLPADPGSFLPVFSPPTELTPGSAQGPSITTSSWKHFPLHEDRPQVGVGGHYKGLGGCSYPASDGMVRRTR